MAKGIFISLEGVEGCGKSTQIRHLEAYLEKRYEVLVTKEPGGTDFGLGMRQLILDKNTRFASNYTELCLFMADRFEHIEKVVKPAIEAGKVVICDRYQDSTVAYQVGGRGMPEDLIKTLHQHVDCLPDLTILLDLPPEEGLKRATKRADLDRFEKESIEFHHRIRNTYLNQARLYPKRIKSVACEGLSEADVFDKVRIIIDNYFFSAGG